MCNIYKNEKKDRIILFHIDKMLTYCYIIIDMCNLGELLRVYMKKNDLYIFGGNERITLL